MFKGVSIYFLSWALILSTSCIYIYGFFPSPYYIFISLGFLLLSIHYNKLKFEFYGVVLFFIVISYFGIIQFYNATFNVWSYYLIALSISLFTVFSRDSLNGEDKNKLIKLTTYIYLIIYSIDTLYRFSFPKKGYIESVELNNKADLIFYAYKHSFVFQDSNFVGLSLLMLFFLILTNKCFLKNKKYLLLFTTILIVLSLSRAAIIILIIMFLVYVFMRLKLSLNLKVVSIVLFFISLFIFFGIESTALNINDDSLSSKFMLLNKFIDSITNLSITELLFGWGLNQTYSHWGISAHNLYITLILETGIVGIILIMVVFLYFYKKSRKCIYQLMALSLISLSFGLIFTPVLIPIALNCLTSDSY